MTFLERISCPACFRFKFSPIHWFMRWAGICDGRNSW
jgi:hypothetical protein